MCIHIHVYVLVISRGVNEAPSARSSQTSAESMTSIPKLR